jgi:hypothetical protein
MRLNQQIRTISYISTNFSPWSPFLILGTFTLVPVLVFSLMPREAIVNVEKCPRSVRAPPSTANFFASFYGIRIAPENHVLNVYAFQIL